ncbi:MAG: hypothetical protein ACRELY_27020 [Polyangiaceae bacterium]
MVSTTSACMGTCNCRDDAPPHWTGSIDLTWDAAYRSETSCEATMTRGANVIDFKVAFACAKTGGAIEDAATGMSDCAVGVGQDGFVFVSFQLNAEDESFLGGFDFTFDITCDDGTERHSSESFSTQFCEG